MNEDLLGLEMKCVVCTNPVPQDKARRRGVTCSKECADLRTRLLRLKVDNRECRFCHKPSTPNARKAFSRFRRWERENPNLAYPEQWKIVEGAGVSLTDFGKAINQAVKFDVEFGSKLSAFDFESTKTLPAAHSLPAEMRCVMEILRNQPAPEDEEEHGDEAA